LPRRVDGRVEAILERTGAAVNELIANLDKLHTTEMGKERIMRNLGITTSDAVDWCKQLITAADEITRKGKNWYANIGNVVVTVNAHSYTIITAHVQRMR
jgi:ethanolamine utilization microcompartment shell protein EutL